MIIDDIRYETVIVEDVDYEGSKEQVNIICIKPSKSKYWFTLMNREKVCLFFKEIRNVISFTLDAYNNPDYEENYKKQMKETRIYKLNDYDLSTNDLIIKAIEDDKDAYAKLLKTLMYIAMFDDEKGKRISNSIKGKDIDKSFIINNINIKELADYYLFT